MMTQKIRYRYVFNRKNRLNAMGEALVQIEARQRDRKTYFATGIYVKPTEWSGQEVTGRVDATMLNGMLQQVLMRLQEIEMGVWRQGLWPQLEHLRQGVRRVDERVDGSMTDGRAEGSMTDSQMDEKLTDRQMGEGLTEFAQRVVEVSGRRKSTKDCLMTTVRIMERWRRGLTLLDLDYDLLCNFEQHLREQGDCKNTIAKHMQNLRTIVGEARRRNVPTGWPPRGYRIRTQRSERTSLSDDELRRIAATTSCPSVRDAFLFCCVTGLRYSDYVRLKSEHFVVRDGEQWLQLRMHKTGRPVALPLQLLSGVLGRLPPHPAIGCNKQTNVKLRSIVAEAGIKGKRVTFHCARHTFATQLLAHGVPITTVQILLGHTKLRTTQRYAQVKEQTVVNDLMRAGQCGRTSS